jgi:hypothetical protein
VTLGVTKRTGTIDAKNKVSVKQAVRIKNLLSYKGPDHSADDILALVGSQVREGLVQGVAVGKSLNTEEGLEFINGWAVA